jgi:hypothetical protein
MSYYVKHTGGRFTIRKASFDVALKALKGTKNLQWADKKAFNRIKTLESFLAKHLWNADIDGNGDIIGIDYDGENLGESDLIFSVLGPYIKGGSYIEMMGEEGESWRYVFDGEKCREIHPTVIWENENEV